MNLYNDKFELIRFDLGNFNSVLIIAGYVENAKLFYRKYTAGEIRLMSIEFSKYREKYGKLSFGAQRGVILGVSQLPIELYSEGGRLLFRRQ